MADIAICAPIRNEESYIYEWLSFHYVMGIKHFYIYENRSTDRTLDVIKSWPRPEAVTIIDWPHFPGQPAAFQHFISSMPNDVPEWVAFIDCDEFLCPQTERSISEILDGLDERITGLFVHWLMFGSSGNRHYQSSPVTETFTRRGHKEFSPNRVGKSIVRARSATLAPSTHIIRSKGKLVNDSGEEIDQYGDGIHHSSSHQSIALHHYFTKSLDEWRSRRNLGRVDLEVSHNLYIRSEEEFHQHDVNDVIDLTASNLMKKVRTIFY